MLYNINNFISNSAWKYIFYGIDIILVAGLFYLVYIFVYNTRAYSVVAGFIILFFITFMARVFGLTTLSWIFDKFFQVGLIAIVVLFQAEIRHGLRILGGRAFFKKSFGYDENNIKKILSASFNLSYKGHGALIVFQKNISLHSLIDRAVKLNADISIELVEAIFFKNNPSGFKSRYFAALTISLLLKNIYPFSLQQVPQPLQENSNIRFFFFAFVFFIYRFIKIIERLISLCFLMCLPS